MPVITQFPEVDVRRPQPFRPPGTAGDILDVATAEVDNGRPIVVREICRTLGLTPGAPYSHFHSATQIDNLVVFNGLLELAGHLASAVVGMSEPRERLVAVCHAYREWALQHPSRFAYIFPPGGREIEPSVSERVIDASRAMAVPGASAMADGWAQGTFVAPGPGPAVEVLSIPGIVELDVDQSRVANAIWAAVHGALIMEMAIGVHDGWDARRGVFDWHVTAQIVAHLERPRN